ncbi:predicted protein [Histoplasma capsulatum var. duboisii H88]|uniref:Predicted protein n=1 Tax=Ajellomyces capsulatus (strain H88) TaxID=544711 RepID=F0U761_AJEC8|nr:predicted protein [Histoplasma capsulatum var. duboisii H88]
MPVNKKNNKPTRRSSSAGKAVNGERPASEEAGESQSLRLRFQLKFCGSKCQGADERLRALGQSRVGDVVGDVVMDAKTPAADVSSSKPSTAAVARTKAKQGRNVNLHFRTSIGQSSLQHRTWSAENFRQAGSNKNGWMNEE